MYFRADAVEMKVFSTLSNAGVERVIDAVLCASKNIYGIWHYTVMGIVEDCTLVPLSRSFETPDEGEKTLQDILQHMSQERRRRKRERQERMLKEADYRRKEDA